MSGTSDMSYKERREDWEARMEGLLIEVMSETDERGLAMFISVTPVMSAFCHVLADIDVNRKSHKYTLKPGGKINE
jgi:hypothetical protein